MKKRSLFLFGILSLGWLQPFCTAVATTETSPQNYPAVTNNSLRDSMLFTVNSQPTSSKPTSGSITQESNSEKGTSPTVSSTKAANEETMPGSDNAESTSTANKKTASLTTSSTKHSAKEETSKKGAATEKTVKNGAVTSGTWGTAPYKWDASSGTLTVSAGDLQDTDKAPWKLSSPVMQASDIQIINFEGSVMAPVNSSELFSRLSNLEKINSLSLLNTSSVTDMSSMFKSDSRLTDLDLSHFDTSKVQNMNCMFNVIGTSKLDLSSFVTSNVKDMGWMFADSTALESVIFPSTFTTDQVRDMTGMFRWTAITTLDISTFNNNLVPVNGMSSMFKNMMKLKSLTLGKNFSFKTIDAGLPSILQDNQYTGKWQNLGNGTTDFPTGKNVWSSSEFMNIYNGNKDADTYVWQPKGVGLWGTAPYKWDASSGTLTVSAGDLQDTKKAPWKLSPPAMKASDIRIINFEGSVMAPVNSSELFSELSKLEKFINLPELNTSSVTDMSGMFYWDSSLKNLDLSQFNTSKVQTMRSMFNATGITKLDLSTFDTSSVIDMGWMFADSTALESVIFPSTFTTDQVQDMTGMFRSTVITTLDISTFSNNLVPVDGMSSMFKNMTKLKSLTLGKYFSFKTIDTGLPDPPNDKNFGGKWRNVSSGTPQNPLGKNLWTADEFMKNYNGSSDEDTYVWQPKGIYINEVADTFSFPKVQLSGNKQTVTPTGNAHLTLTDALPKNDTGTQLLVSYETPDGAWQKAGLSLKITPTTTQTYVKTTEVLVSSDPAPIITQFDESEKQAATFVDLDLAPELTVPPASAALVPKDYSTTIDWTIQQGPK